VPLGGMQNRLAGAQVNGLRELAAAVDSWERKLVAAMAAGSEGGDASDVVHQVFANAELSQLRARKDVVVRLATHLPPKLRATYLVGASEEAQAFWVEVLAACRSRTASGRIEPAQV